MKIVIDIPDKDIPERGQYMLDAYFDFHTGELCSCSYPYTVLPKGHGILDEADELSKQAETSLKYLETTYTSTVLDAIKTEIKEEAECAYADFDRYKVEYLGQDWEDVSDSLPQDDFRYGMERAVEIINKRIVKEH